MRCVRLIQIVIIKQSKLFYNFTMVNTRNALQNN